MKRIFTAVVVLFCISTSTFAQKLRPNINHISYYVMNYNMSVSFYTRVLGLDSVSVEEQDGRQVTAFNIGDGLQLNLISGRGSRDITQMNHSHLSFTVESVAAFAQKLDFYKIAWFGNGKRGNIATRPDGIKEITFKDPDGYEFEIIESNTNRAVAAL